MFTFCILLSGFSAPVMAAASAALLPSVPMCAFTHAIVHPLVLHLRFSSASAVFSAIVDLKSILSKAYRADCESVSIFTYLGLIVLKLSSMYFF